MIFQVGRFCTAAQWDDLGEFVRLVARENDVDFDYLRRDVGRLGLLRTGRPGKRQCDGGKVPERISHGLEVGVWIAGKAERQTLGEAGVERWYYLLFDEESLSSHLAWLSVAQGLATRGRISWSSSWSFSDLLVQVPHGCAKAAPSRRPTPDAMLQRIIEQGWLHLARSPCAEHLLAPSPGCVGASHAGRFHFPP